MTRPVGRDLGCSPGEHFGAVPVGRDLGCSQCEHFGAVPVGWGLECSQCEHFGSVPVGQDLGCSQCEHCGRRDQRGWIWGSGGLNLQRCNAKGLKDRGLGVEQDQSQLHGAKRAVWECL